MNLGFSRDAFHRQVYLTGLFLLVCSLPLSRYLLSIAQFVLVINWIASGSLREKYTALRHNRSLLFFASLFAVYAIGLLHTGNLTNGLDHVKNALPLLALPVVVGTSSPLTGRNLRQILLIFSGAVLTASAVCLIRYLYKGLPVEGDFRSVSVFMRHIRFALLIVMAIFGMLYLLYDRQRTFFRGEKFLYGGIACLLIAFLFFLRSFTGIFVFMMLMPVFLLNRALLCHRPGVRNLILVFAAGFLTTLVVIPAITYRQNFSAKPVDPGSLESHTAGNRPYVHDTRSGALENGYYIDLYVCEPELRQEWNRISAIPYDGADRKGQPLAFTLKRYLTSMGWRKDSVAVRKLDAEAIAHIEHGLANRHFREDPGLSQRLYETLWEIQIMLKTGYVLQHSIGQRFAFLKAAKNLLRKQLWTGTGTGDVFGELLQSARKSGLEIDPKWEGKPHNQFLFFLLAFGLPGMIYILFCLAYPVIATRTYRHLLFNLFAGIMLLSMLAMDTLESYDSMVFFACFYTVFVFGHRPVAT